MKLSRTFYLTPEYSDDQGKVLGTLQGINTAFHRAVVWVLHSKPPQTPYIRVRARIIAFEKCYAHERSPK